MHIKPCRLLSNLNNNSSFVRNTKDTSKEINKLSSWNSQQQILNCHMNSEIKENIYELFDKLWNKQIEEASKGNKGNSTMRTYIKFKVNLNLEENLTC